MKRLYYHIYLTDEYGSWAYPFMEQMKLMEDHGLLSELNQIDFSVITQKDRRIDIFIGLIKTFNINAVVTLYGNTHSDDSSMLSGINNQDTVTENVTMRKIYNDAKDRDDEILYLHTKGITSVDKQLKVGNIDTFKNYYYWRHFLNWGVVERWREAVRLLDRFDIVGVNYFDQPAPHFSGSFWWTKSSYIRTLPDPSTLDWWKQLQSNSSDHWLRTAPDRFRDEMWHCSNPNAKVVSLKNLTKVTNLSAELILRKEYA